MTDAADAAYIPPRERPLIARCGNCGTAYTEISWALLPSLGTMRLVDEVLELRNCGICKPASTLSISVPAPKETDP